VIEWLGGCADAEAASLNLGVKTKSPVPPQIVRPYAARSKVDPVGVGLGGEAARGIDGTRAAECEWRTSIRTNYQSSVSLRCLVFDY
jgi:hypothetical protein